MNEPFAIATELADQLEGELESKFQTARGEFLSKLKKALLLYVNAKYVDRVRFTSLEPHLMQIGVGGRSVNGAWGIELRLGSVSPCCRCGRPPHHCAR